jgi:arylsulfatase A-like enzyme
MDKPNILIILVDELRYPTVYENEELKEWQRKNLRSFEFLRHHGLEYKRHYIGSSACSSSRGTLFTSEYPSLHGVTQVSGIAKTSYDPDVFWLDSNTVPTLGDYFTNSDYKLYYKGKWHVSLEDIDVPGTNNALMSNDLITGLPNKYISEVYLKANKLEKYGFKNWIGPEPHGPSGNNSGSSAPTPVGGRDAIFSEQTCDLIRKLDKKSHKKPWLIVSSFVNPHDITLHGDYSAGLPIYDFIIDPTVPYIPPPPTADEDLSTKPLAQASYKETLPLALQPIVTTAEKHRRLYYSLQKRVDDQICKVLETIKKSSMYENTIIIFTSDHGEQLLAHGLEQKWHNMYEESLHVPLIIHNPILFPKYRCSDQLTSHVDLVPTILKLANIKVRKVAHKLKRSHTEVHPLVGRCLSFRKTEIMPNYPIYFLTMDQPTQGLNQINPFTGIPYSAVKQPNNIEAIVVYLTDPLHLYKYAHYFDPDNKLVNEYEMYNLSDDPLETRNLANPTYSTRKTKIVQAKLEKMLIAERKKKALVPTLTVTTIFDGLPGE